MPALKNPATGPALHPTDPMASEQKELFLCPASFWKFTVGCWAEGGAGPAYTVHKHLQSLHLQR